MKKYFVAFQWVDANGTTRFGNASITSLPINGMAKVVETEKALQKSISEAQSVTIVSWQRFEEE